MIGELQVPKQQPAVGARVRSHSSLARRDELAQARHRSASRIEQLLRAVAAHPLLQHAQMPGLGSEPGERDLMRPPGPLDLQPIDDSRTRPPLRAFEHDHRPPRTPRFASASLRTNGCDGIDDAVQRGGHLDVHRFGLIARHKVRLPAIARQQALELGARNAREHRGISDLVAVQMQNRQHRPIGGGI